MANPLLLTNTNYFGSLTWEVGEYLEYAEIWEIITQSFNKPSEGVKTWIAMFTNADIKGGGGMDWLYGG